MRQQPKAMFSKSWPLEWREHFLDIKKLVLIGGPDDGVITPWQSRYQSFIFNCIQGKIFIAYYRNKESLSTVHSLGGVV